MAALEDPRAQAYVEAYRILQRRGDIAAAANRLNPALRNRVYEVFAQAGIPTQPITGADRFYSAK